MVNIDKYLLVVEKPAQYLGNELNTVHKEEFDANMCLFFPDTYEIGMSSVGIRILYFLLNKVEGFSLERAFSPMADMEELMRKDNIPMFSLESKRELKDFDIIGFSLSYELSYTNILNALDMANIPLRAEDRKEEDPLVMAGGTCVMNPSPLVPFFDYFVIGDGEEAMVKVAEIMVANKGKSKREKLELIKDIDGVYIPSIHKGQKVRRAIIEDLHKSAYLGEQIVPYTEIVHDRAVIEIQRGCTRGCRFCQAGMVYRPVRERTLEENMELIENAINTTGYSEVSLSSLSSSDYTKIGDLLYKLQDKYGKDNLGIQLPSLRMHPHSVEVAEKITSGKKTGFTFAPEAGSQRLRDVINKGVDEKEILDTAEAAVRAGWQSLKFYFMIGLPFETDEDVLGIHELAKKVLCKVRSIDKRVNITVSVSNFVPKAHTPFQWAEQMTFEEMERKHKMLKDLFYKTKGAYLKIHEMEGSFLEGIIARGDEKIGELIELAFKKGAKFDGWREFFKLSRWREAMDELGIDPLKYTGERNLKEDLPWDFIDTGISKRFYLDELRKAEETALTPDCRENCAGCGMKTRIIKCGSLVADNK